MLFSARAYDQRGGVTLHHLPRFLGLLRTRQHVCALCHTDGLLCVKRCFSSVTAANQQKGTLLVSLLVVCDLQSQRR